MCLEEGEGARSPEGSPGALDGTRNGRGSREGQLVDLHEKPLAGAKANLKDREVEIHFEPFQIRTIKMH